MAAFACGSDYNGMHSHVDDSEEEVVEGTADNLARGEADSRTHADFEIARYQRTWQALFQGMEHVRKLCKAALQALSQYRSACRIQNSYCINDLF